MGAARGIRLALALGVAGCAVVGGLSALQGSSPAGVTLDGVLATAERRRGATATVAAGRTVGLQSRAGQPVLLATPLPMPVLATLQPRFDAGSTPTPQRYAVQAGDTLSAIAREYGVTVAALPGANGISDANTLRVDQELVIPGP